MLRILLALGLAPDPVQLKLDLVHFQTLFSFSIRPSPTPAGKRQQFLMWGPGTRRGFYQQNFTHEDCSLGAPRGWETGHCTYSSHEDVDADSRELRPGPGPASDDRLHQYFRHWLPDDFSSSFPAHKRLWRLLVAAGSLRQSPLFTAVYTRVCPQLNKIKHLYVSVLCFDLGRGPR